MLNVYLQDESVVFGGLAYPDSNTVYRKFTLPVRKIYDIWESLYTIWAENTHTGYCGCVYLHENGSVSNHADQSLDSVCILENELVKLIIRIAEMLGIRYLIEDFRTIQDDKTNLTKVLKWVLARKIIQYGVYAQLNWRDYLIARYVNYGVPNEGMSVINGDIMPWFISLIVILIASLIIIALPNEPQPKIFIIFWMMVSELAIIFMIANELRKAKLS